MSPPRTCKCSRFLTSLDVDGHSSLSKYREFKCAQSKSCDICSSWDGSQLQRVGTYEKGLVISEERCQKEGIRAQNCSSESSSGFSIIFNVSNVAHVSNGSPLVDEVALQKEVDRILMKGAVELVLD